MFGYIIVIVICGFVLFKIGQDISNGLNSRNWPITQGRVHQSGLHTREKTDEDGFSSRSYGATVLYKYDVSGQEYNSTRRAFSDVRSSSVRRAEEILERYPQGSAVTVYYHPNKPSLSVLEPGVHWMTYFGMIVVLGIFIFGIVGALGFIG